MISDEIDSNASENQDITWVYIQFDADIYNSYRMNNSLPAFVKLRKRAILTNNYDLNMQYR